MSRCLALLLAVLLLFPPEADLADTLRAATLAGDAVEALGGFRAFPRGAGGLSPVEVCLSGEGFGRGPLVLLRSDGGEVRCFTLRRPAPGAPAALSPCPLPPPCRAPDWTRVSKPELFLFFLLHSAGL